MARNCLHSRLVLRAGPDWLRAALERGKARPVCSSAAAWRAGCGVPTSLWARLPPLDQLHGEVGPAGPVAGVVDLYEVRVSEGSDRLGLPPEPFPLVRAGVGAGQRHLEGDEAAQAQVPRPVDYPHSAATEDGLDLVAGD